MLLFFFLLTALEDGDKHMDHANQLNWSNKTIM